MSAASVSAVGSAPVRNKSERHVPSKSERHGPNLTKVAWIPQGDLEYPEWVAAGRRLGVLGRGSQWWVGDWLRYGAGIWGEKYVAASKITGYDVGSLRNIASLASQFDLSRRRDNLTWCHHAAVASLELDEQDYWLDRSVAERLSVADLRDLRRSQSGREVALIGDGDPSAAPSAAEVVICPHCGGEVPL
jgi:hypothetical protein